MPAVCSRLYAAEMITPTPASEVAVSGANRSHDQSSREITSGAGPIEPAGESVEAPAGSAPFIGRVSGDRASRERACRARSSSSSRSRSASAAVTASRFTPLVSAYGSPVPTPTFTTASPNSRCSNCAVTSTLRIRSNGTERCWRFSSPVCSSIRRSVIR